MRKPQATKRPSQGAMNAEDLYVANVLAERACPLCGTDRMARSAHATPCAACGDPLPPGEAFVFVHARKAAAACSVADLALLKDAGSASDRCPACGTPWRGARLLIRSCGTCTVDLDPNAGYVAHMHAGRVRTFCDVACLEAHLARANPFCG